MTAVREALCTGGAPDQPGALRLVLSPVDTKGHGVMARIDIPEHWQYIDSPRPIAPGTLATDAPQLFKIQ